MWVYLKLRYFYHVFSIFQLTKSLCRFDFRPSVHLQINKLWLHWKGIVIDWSLAVQEFDGVVDRLEPWLSLETAFACVLRFWEMEDVAWFHIARFSSWGETKGFETQMSEIFRCAEEVAESHVLARRFIFAYLFMLMIKFFKAFGILESLRYSAT